MESSTKVLFIDIETSPIIGKVWSLWKQNVSLDQIEDDWYIMSYSAKWLGLEDVIYEDCRNTFEDDRCLLVGIHKLLSEADVVIAHNGDKFDIRKINARLILNGFSPPSPYKTVDTLKIAKKHFAFTSNKLAYLTNNLCVDKKLDHGKFPGMKLWNECMLGNEEAWDEMREYNIMDVISLEELYIKLRPWYTSHPILGIFSEEELETEMCPHCGGTHLQKRGFTVTNSGKYQRYRCQDCFSWSQSRFSKTTRQERELLLKPAR